MMRKFRASQLWTYAGLGEEAELAAVLLGGADKVLANLAIRANLVAEVSDDLRENENQVFPVSQIFWQHQRLLSRGNAKASFKSISKRVTLLCRSLAPF